MSVWRRLRFVPVAVGVMALATGLWTGLTRLGLALPAPPAAADLHAAFMICGFLGTVISLERAVAIGHGWAYGAPAFGSLGALALLAGYPLAAGSAFVAAGAILTLLSIRIAARQPALFTIVLVVAAACWMIGTIKWLAGDPLPAVAGWWLNFLILTIAAERLELSRLLRLPQSSLVTFAIVTALLLFGAVRDELAREWAPFTGIGLLGCAAWLLHRDVARRTIRLGGLPRFSAAAILAGHLWLAAAGGVLLLAHHIGMTFAYDAAVHAIAIGFVLSMIFGHAPIIFPAIADVRIAYSVYLFLPLALLHMSVVLRVAGDLFEGMDLRAASGVLTAAAMIGYAATLVLTSWNRGRLRA